MNNLVNKNVLLLSPCFFGYENEIQKNLRNRGAVVSYHPVNPSSQYRTVLESLKRFSIPTNWMIKKFEDKVYKRISQTKYDYILVICGWAVTSRLTHLMRESLLNENGRMILYYWDSMDRLKDDKRRWNDFDAIYTFDMVDARKYSDKVKLLPLFYCEKYWNVEAGSHGYDGMIIGSFRLDRLDYVRKLRRTNPALNIGSYLFSAKWEILFHKTLRKKYRGIKITELNYKKLSFDQVIDLYKKSQAVIDIPAEYQNGLTIRTFETLAMHKKLITSNKNIVECDFYHPDNIYIVEGDYELPTKEWFDKPFSMADDIIKKYSLTKWLNVLLSLL